MTTIRGLVALLRSDGADLGAAAGRSRERHRRLVLSFGAAFLARAVTFGSMLAAIPIAVDYLGGARYGVVATIVSLTALIGFSDLGIGNGLIAAVSDAEGRGDHDAHARSVSSAFFLLMALALVLAVTFAVAYPFVPWAKVLNAPPPQAAREAGPAVAAFAACVLAAMPLGVAQRLHMGLQESFVPSAWTAVGAVVGLIALVTATVTGAGLAVIVGALVGGPVVGTALNSLVTFGRTKRALRPQLRLADFNTGRLILRLGLMFFVLQIAVAIAFESDALVLAHVIGPRAVTTYWVSFRIFSLSPVLLTFILAPLWPAYSEAMAHGDTAWVHRTLRRSLVIAVAVSVPIAVLLVGVGRPLIHLWVPAVHPRSSLLVALGIWTVLMCIGGTVSAFLNGARIIRFQVIAAGVMVAVNLPLSIKLTQTIGISGVVWGSVIAQTAIVLLPSAIVIPVTLRRIAGRADAPPAA